jgi:hypothetical protein
MQINRIQQLIAASPTELPPLINPKESVKELETDKKEPLK